MSVICPHCQNPIESADLASHNEVNCPACGSTFRLDRGTTIGWSSIETPHTVGRFELLEAVGSGGFGTVYRARDPELDRFVAVKLPRAGKLAGPQEMDRFLREARSVAQLRHPGIVTVHEVGQREGIPFLVSDFVAGVTLADFLSGRRPTHKQAAEWIAALADALEYAHQHGVVHRDVKPSNIMISQDGTPVMMDFGLAKREAGDVTMTVEGQVLGTPAYMSPEQARGDAHQVDGRSDVYSLGVVLYQILTGELPFRGTPRMLLHQVLTDEPRSPRSLNDRIPRDLETICLKAMAKTPEKRYTTAQAFADDLRRFVKGEPIHARPVRAWERAINWTRKHPASAALFVVSTVAALALVGVVVGLIYNSRLEDAYQTTEGLRKGEAEQRRRAETNSYFARLVLAEREWSGNNVGRAEELLDDCSVGMRGWEWFYLKRLCHCEEKTIRGPAGGAPGASSGAAFSPDCSLVIYPQIDNSFKVCDSATGAYRFSLIEHKGEGSLNAMVFSPNGRYFASSTGEHMSVGDGVKIWDLSAPKAKPLTLPAKVGWYSAVAFSADGTRIAVGCGEFVRPDESQPITLWDTSTGKEVLPPLPALHTRPVICVAFSPDGKYLVSGSGNADGATIGRRPGEIIVWDLATRKALHIMKGHEGAVMAVAFCPKGTTFASASQDQTVRLWDAASGKELFSCRGHTQAVNLLSFSPDGSRLASAGNDSTVKVWDPETGRELLTLRGHPDAVYGLQFHPDGKHIYSTGNNGTDTVIKVWNATRSPEARTLRGHDGWVTGVAFSPDGKQLVSSSVDRTVKIWDVASSKELDTLTGHTAPVWGVAFSSDGKRLASAAGRWDNLDGTGEVILWDALRGKKLHKLSANRAITWSVAFSPDSSLLAMAGGELNTEGSLELFQLSTGTKLRTFAQAKRGFSETAFDTSGQRLAAVCANGSLLTIWDAASGREEFTYSDLSTETAVSLAFQPHGKLLAVSSGSEVKLLDPSKGTEVGRLRGHVGYVTRVVFSSDGKRIATTSYDRTIKVWDAATGQETITLHGHTDIVWSVAFSPDGQRIASASQDGTIKIWDATPLE